MVTPPAAAIVTCPAAAWATWTTVLTGKATEALVGTVRMIALAFDASIILPASVRTSV